MSQCYNYSVIDILTQVAKRKIPRCSLPIQNTNKQISEYKHWRERYLFFSRRSGVKWVTGHRFPWQGRLPKMHREDAEMPVHLILPCNTDLSTALTWELGREFAFSLKSIGNWIFIHMFPWPWLPRDTCTFPFWFPYSDTRWAAGSFGW